MTTGCLLYASSAGPVAASQRKTPPIASMGRKESRQEESSVSSPASHGPVSVARAQTTARMPKAGLTSRAGRQSRFEQVNLQIVGSNDQDIVEVEL